MPPRLPPTTTSHIRFYRTNCGCINRPFSSTSLVNQPRQPPNSDMTHPSTLSPKHKTYHTSQLTQSTRVYTIPGTKKNPTQSLIRVAGDAAQTTSAMENIVRGHLTSMGEMAKKQHSLNVEEIQDHLEGSDRAKALERQVGRKWSRGDVYAPHDLSPVESKKWKTRGGPSRDVFDAMGINPLDEYKNFAIMSEFMTETGRIKHSSLTGLRPSNQRKIAKAIRRAVGLGLMPSVHHHPEILEHWSKIQRHRHRPTG